jgi:hypothetical protein
LKDRYFELKDLIGVLLLFSVLFYGCQKGDETLGMNLLPGVQVIDARYLQDKSSITAFTFSDDKIVVDRPRYNLLGSFNDPLFGLTNGSFAAQFRMPYYPRFESDATLDSLILQMSYKYVYGDTLTPQTILVHELSGDLFYDDTYLSSYNIKNRAFPDILGSGSFTPLFRTDSTKADTSSQIIRIKLDPNLGNRLLKMDSLNMVSNDKFITLFKGLFIETAPVSQKGSLLQIDAPSAALVVYYHTAEHDTLGYAYKVSGNSANISSFFHDYSTTKFFPHMNQEIIQDSLVYLQPTGGTKIKVNMPKLSSWRDSTNYVINKATLIVHVDTIATDMRRFEIPPQIYLKVINDNGDEEFPKDGELSLSYYGGIYNTLTATYNFNITQHLQQIINGEKHNNGFYLVQPGRLISPKRVVLKGGTSSRGTSSATPIEFDVTYTRFK